MHKLAHPDGELATSRAAANHNIPMALSSYATESIEAVAAQGKGNPYVMQMCVVRDRNITLQLLKRAEGRDEIHSSQGYSPWLMQYSRVWMQCNLPLCRRPRTWPPLERVQKQVCAS